MRLYQFIMIIGLFFLVIAGLNICNQGISNLTGEERQAILSLSYTKSNISIEAIGESYSYSLDRLPVLLSSLVNEGKLLLTETTEYLGKIWDIFDAVFLKE
ncbi:MAG: hypothetical protein ACOX6E_02310 [Syntrophomonadaceae bacterium]|jgi:hypothetical protein